MYLLHIKLFSFSLEFILEFHFNMMTLSNLSFNWSGGFMSSLVLTDVGAGGWLDTQT